MLVHQLQVEHASGCVEIVQSMDFGVDIWLTNIGRCEIGKGGIKIMYILAMWG